MAKQHGSFLRQHLQHAQRLTQHIKNHRMKPDTMMLMNTPAIDSAHAESFNCIGVLELRKQNAEAAQANFATSQKLAPYLFEPFYNGALLAYKMGNFQDAFLQVTSALDIYPDHSDSLELKRTLGNLFAVL